MTSVQVIIEMDIERDRKACLALDLKVSGANRELAQWVANHKYSNVDVAGWLGCNESRIRKLRKWAEEGFVGAYDKSHPERKSPTPANQPLKSLNNIDDQEDEADELDVADPAIVEDNVLYTLARVIEHMGVAGTGAKFVRLGKSVRYRAKGIAVGDGDEDWQEDSRYGLDS